MRKKLYNLKASRLWPHMFGSGLFLSVSISKGHYKVIIEVIAQPISLFTYTDEDIIIIIISSEIILLIYLCVCIHTPHQSVNNLWYLSTPDLHNPDS